jgi:hypothetical protein
MASADAFCGVEIAAVATAATKAAANDYRSGHELATHPRSKYPLPLPDPPGTLGQIVRASRVADPDYTKVSAP